MATEKQFIPSGCKNSLPTSPYCENMFLTLAGFMKGGNRLI